MKTRTSVSQLNFLHKIITRNEDDWTRNILETMWRLDIGWGRQIKKTLSNFNLPSKKESIANMSVETWKFLVKSEAEEFNRQKLRHLCTETKDYVVVRKRETSYILDKTENDGSRNVTLGKIKGLLRLKAKALIMGQSQMLQCKNNF